MEILTQPSVRLSGFLLKLYVTFGFHSSSNTKGKGRVDEVQTLERRLDNRDSAISSSAAEPKRITFASVSLLRNGGRKEREQRRVRGGGTWGVYTDPVRAHSQWPASCPWQGSEAPSPSPLTCPCKSAVENPSKCSVDTKCFLLSAQLCISEQCSTAPFGGENGLDRTAKVYPLPRPSF